MVESPRISQDNKEIASRNPKPGLTPFSVPLRLKIS